MRQVRCPYCGLGIQVRDDAIMVTCRKCGESIKIKVIT